MNPDHEPALLVLDYLHERSIEQWTDTHRDQFLDWIRSDARRARTWEALRLDHAGADLPRESAAPPAWATRPASDAALLTVALEGDVSIPIAPRISP